MQLGVRTVSTTRESRVELRPEFVDLTDSLNSSQLIIE